MKASAVFVQQSEPRATLRASDTDFFAIQMTTRADLYLHDEVTGDLALNKRKWFFNLTREKLIEVQTIGRFETLVSAIKATSVGTKNALTRHV